MQNISGIDLAYDLHPYDGKKELHEQFRRQELQAECLAGVFIGSVWDSLDRTEEDWETLLELDRRRRAAWLDKGFRATSPAACNTWTAPPSKVS